MFLDSSAWFEYFAGTGKGAAVKKRMDATETLFSSPTVLAELHSKYTRSGEAAQALERGAFIREQSAIIDITADVGLEAGRIHAKEKLKKPKFSMSDAFILAAARARSARLVTFDPDFGGIDDVDVLEDP